MKRVVKYINQKNNSVRKNKVTISSRPVLILVVFILAFLLVQLLNLSIVGTKGSELSAIKKEQSIVEENIRELKAQISEATALDRIALIAKEKLGMQKVTDVKYLDEGGYVSDVSYELK